ncbi:MAG: tRNA (adenosine(37)-N6)-threonylcarbamoyltransferase complex ATPase subunit type 1 TsaE [Polaromonas sp.]
MAWPDEIATEALARALAQRPALGRALIELRGDLGAGKTTFARHLLKSLGVSGRIKSPTYAVVETYTVIAPGLDTLDNRELVISHFDFYRFNDPREWEEAGFRDVFASPGLKLVEWPEKAGKHLPQPDLVIAIEMLADATRSVTLTAHTPMGAELLE